MPDRAVNPVSVVTIDGPSGSGKGTIAALLAERLGWHLLDSGALYRIVAAVALARRIALDDEQALCAMAIELEIAFETSSNTSSNTTGVMVDGDDLSVVIRTEPVSVAASQVAALKGVRTAILETQQRMRQEPGLVADGRDMGTVVFKDAALKIYLDASVEERAERRYNQLKNKGLSVSLRALLASLTARDERDKGRAVSPLMPAPDALVIDSTDLSIDAVLTIVHAEVQARHLV